MAALTAHRINTHFSSFRPWYLYIGSFLTVWGILIFRYGFFPVVFRPWPISLVMVLGSLVAGSTPMGGGAISFPYLVLWLNYPPNDARDFGLMIQAAGMVSAMIFILCRRIPLQPKMLAWTIIGAAAGVFLGTIAIAPHIPGNLVKLTFACMWMSFAIVTIAKSHEFC